MFPYLIVLPSCKKRKKVGSHVRISQDHLILRDYDANPPLVGDHRIEFDNHRLCRLSLSTIYFYIIRSSCLARNQHDTPWFHWFFPNLSFGRARCTLAGKIVPSSE